MRRPHSRARRPGKASDVLLGAFDFQEVAEGQFVEAEGGVVQNKRFAPFFIDLLGMKPEAGEDVPHRVEVADLDFKLRELFEFRVGLGGCALVGQGAFAIPAQPQQVSGAPGGPWPRFRNGCYFRGFGQTARAERQEIGAHGGQVRYMEFDFGFDRVHGSRPWWMRSTR